MVELMVGAALTGVFLTSIAPLIRWTQLTGRLAEQQSVAMRELSSQMEQLAALPPDMLTPDRLSAVTLSEGARAVLPDGSLTAELGETEDGLRRAVLSAVWTDDAGRQIQPVRLTAWLTVPREP